MKGIALILVSVLFMLTVQPVASQAYAMYKQHHWCCSKSCCHNKCGTGKCFPETCTTCASCISFFGFFEHGTAGRYKAAVTRKVYAVTGAEKLISAYYANCFHPPEFV